MKCKAIEKQVIPYLQGWLEPEERTRFEAHIAGCEVCRQMVELEREISRRLLVEEDDSLELADDLGGMPEAIMREVEAEERAAGVTPGRKRAWLWPAMAGAAASVALVVGLFIGLRPVDSIKPKLSPGDRFVAFLSAVDELEKIKKVDGELLTDPAGLQVAMLALDNDIDLDALEKEVDDLSEANEVTP